MHILFVDDTIDTRELYRFYFTKAGHITDTASNGAEALRLIAQNSDALDVIILDYHMPGMNGLEVVQELRWKKESPSIPIILFTGDTIEELEGRAKKLGVARVVYKPIMPADLIATAQETLAHA